MSLIDFIQSVASSSENSTPSVLRFTPSNPKSLSGASVSSEEDSIFSSPLSVQQLLTRLGGQMDEH